MATNDWKQNLRESTGQMVFVLSLSRRMVEGLIFVRDVAPIPQFKRSDYTNCPTISSHFVVALGALQRRGLVVHCHPDTPSWRLTPAGERVCDLLVFCALMPEKAEVQAHAA